MGLSSKDIQSVDNLFFYTLGDIYYAEQQIAKALPKMIEKGRNPLLRKRLEVQLAETGCHIDRILRVFRQRRVQPKEVRWQAIEGILVRADEISAEAADDVRDAAIVGTAQALERYGIARYGTLVVWAMELGRPDCALLLQQNLQEAKAALANLANIGRNSPTSTPS